MPPREPIVRLRPESEIPLVARNQEISQPLLTGVRAIALIEGAKGAFVLLAGLGLLSLIHRDVTSVAAQIIRLSHLDPASRFSLFFLKAATRMTDARLWFLASTALLYAAIRGVEAYGLWKARQWAEWFTLLSASLCLPFELYQVSRGQMWIPASVFVVNAGIVVYLAGALQHRNERDRHAAKPESPGAVSENAAARALPCAVD